MNVEEQRQMQEDTRFVSLSCADFRNLQRGEVVVKELPARHGLAAIRIQILLKDIGFEAR